MSMADVIYDSEAQMGARPLIEADGVRICENDWSPAPIITRCGDDVRIVAVIARLLGNGAFSRLVGDIRKAGLCPVVIEPMGAQMPSILAKWGWTGRRRLSGLEPGDTYVEWRPAETSQ